MLQLDPAWTTDWMTPDARERLREYGISPPAGHSCHAHLPPEVRWKLFRRLIVFLFVLFIFSFLDRINIGFAGLTMGRDLGLSATMFGLATTLFYAAYVIFGIPSNIMLSIVGARRCAPLRAPPASVIPRCNG